MTRTHDLQSFIDAAEAFIATAGASDNVLAVADKVFSAARDPGIGTARQPTVLPACAFLQTALKTARAHGGPVARLSSAIEHLAPKLQWIRRPNGDSESPEFDTKHANTLVVGPHGLEVRNDIQVGITVLAPHTEYPNHHHSPEEIYAVLSAGEWRQEANPWHCPGVGGIVHNVPNIVHAMRSRDEVLLAVWCLWGS